MKNNLFGKMLLEINNDYNISNIDLDYANSCNTVGIATKKVDGNTIYVVYKVGEHGSIDWEYEYPSFLEALNIAKEKYRHLDAYLEEIDRISRELEFNSGNNFKKFKH